MPWATLTVLGCSLLAFALAGPGSLAYDRGAAHELWRFLSASFVHYDLTHISSNLAAFAILGGALERSSGARALVSLLLATIATTMVTLHLALDHYVTFAGISVVNYALLGALAGRFLPTAPVPAILAVSVVAALQVSSAHGLLVSSVAGTRATWELHLLAQALGLVWVGASRQSRPGGRSHTSSGFAAGRPLPHTDRVP